VGQLFSVCQLSCESVVLCVSVSSVVSLLSCVSVCYVVRLLRSVCLLSF